MDRQTQNVLLCYCMINSSKQVLFYLGRYIRANEQSSNQKWDKSPSTIKMRLILQSYRNIKRFSFTHLSSAWNTVLWLDFTIRRVGSKLAVILKSPRKFDIKKIVELATFGVKYGAVGLVLNTDSELSSLFK